MTRWEQVWTWARVAGGLIALAGLISLILAPPVGQELFDSLWTVEPLAFIGAVLLVVGLAATTLSYFLPRVITWRSTQRAGEADIGERWSEVTQQYFDLFNHDLGRPLRSILGKERELRTRLQTSGVEVDSAFKELLDEIEAQTPNFRLMMSNIQVLVQLEAPPAPADVRPIEPSEVVRRIVDRYTSLASEGGKEITWWAEPTEFGIVMSNSSAVEHIVANLVDNAVRFATTHVEIKLTKNPTHYFIRVWDDGPGVASQYIQHIFDRGWTPQMARREEKSSSGLGLYIARELAQRYGGEVTVQASAEPDPDHHTAFLLSLPMERAGVTLP